MWSLTIEQDRFSMQPFSADSMLIQLLAPSVKMVLQRAVELQENTTKSAPNNPITKLV